VCFLRSTNQARCPSGKKRKRKKEIASPCSLTRQQQQNDKHIIQAALPPPPPLPPTPTTTNEREGSDKRSSKQSPLRPLPFFPSFSFLPLRCSSTRLPARPVFLLSPSFASSHSYFAVKPYLPNSFPLPLPFPSSLTHSSLP
jgi:hypothetical protein